MTVVCVLLVMTTPAGSYVTRTGTALVAAAVLLLAERRGRDTLTVARRCCVGALGLGALSGVMSSLHLAITGRLADPGWIGDWIYLAYAPLAVCGVLALVRRSGRRPGAARAVADGAIAAGSMWFLAMTLVVEPHHLGADLPR